MKPSAIDQHIWNKYYDVYVEDAYDLGLEKTFSEKNPYALQEMTAVMLESARKGMWHATDVQLREVAELHTRLVSEHAAGCSGFICDNAKLRDFIASKVDKEAAESYNKNIDAARQIQARRAEREQRRPAKGGAAARTPQGSAEGRDRPGTERYGVLDCRHSAGARHRMADCTAQTGQIGDGTLYSNHIRPRTGEILSESGHDRPLLDDGLLRLFSRHSYRWRSIRRSLNSPPR